MLEVVASIALVVIVTVVILVAVKMARSLGPLAKDTGTPNRETNGTAGGAETISPIEMKIRSVENSLRFVCVLLGYTAFKWTLITMDYASHGVQAEANIFSLFLVIPVGVLLWLVGVIDQILIIGKILRKDFPLERLKPSSKIILVANCALACLTTIELFLIFGYTS